MPRVRIVLALGLPDPDRLSTTLLWSLLGHLGLLIGVLIYQSLPSRATVREPSYFVRLAAPAGPPVGRGGASSPVAAPVSPAVPTEKPRSEKTPPSKPPTKATIPAEGSKKTVARTTPAPAAHATSADEPAQATTGEAQGTAGPSATGSPSGPAAGPATGGVGGTAFGEGDFQYDWYRSAIEARLGAVWKRPLASAAGDESASVSFTIRRDGAVQDVAIAAPSKNDILDLSVVRAVYDAAPLPPLPRSWKSESVHVTMEFQLTSGAD